MIPRKASLAPAHRCSPPPRRGLPPAGLRKLTRVSANQPWIGPTPLQLDGKQSPGLFANDLRMMAAAGLGLAFNAKPAVRAQADLVIDLVDLREVIPLLPA